MRNRVKLIVMLLAFLGIMIASCKKDNNNTPAPTVDFRDSLIGSYACMTTSSTGNPNGSTSDSARDTVVVSKSGDSAVIVNGTSFAFSDNTQANSGGYQFTGQVTNPISCQNMASFASSGASIYWVNECQTVSSSSSSITQGIKIH